jgi:hypothetical protein
MVVADVSQQGGKSAQHRTVQHSLNDLYGGATFLFLQKEDYCRKAFRV